MKYRSSEALKILLLLYLLNQVVDTCIHFNILWLIYAIGILLSLLNSSQ